jgi:micrococcal nuclease
MKALMVILMVIAGVGTTRLQAEEIQGKVISVVDGNTLEIESLNNETVKVMLVGIDCPELGQQYGDKARQFMEKLILNKEVAVTFQGKDRWGNRLAVVTIVKGSRDPRVELLKEGLAWTSEKNPDPNLDEVRSTAQGKGRGLWKDENPTPPWTYRRQQTMAEAKSS